MVVQSVPHQFAKPLAARQVEARSRVKGKGVRVAVVSEARSYVSINQSRPGITYRIERGRQGWGCECDGYRFTGMCKHIAQVQRRSEREGWAFGQVAPLDRTAPGVSTVDAPTAAAAIILFRPRPVERRQSAATRRANDDLFGA
jgi:hypothetical protein